MGLRERIRPYVWGLDEYVPGEYREGYVKLASNENNYGPGPNVVEALREWSGKAYMYPYRSREVCEGIAEYVGCGPENIVLGNGSDELMDMCVKVFKGPVAGSYPSFAEYPIAAGAVGEKYVSVKLEDNFRFNADRFLEEAGNCNLAFLCSPNNPTGLSIPDDDVKAVLDSGKTVVLDEAYYEFSGKTRVEWTDDYQNLIVLRTMAKAFALAGLRIGYAVAGEEAADALSRVKPPFNVNLLAESAALAALEDTCYMRECVDKITADRNRIYDALSKRFKTWRSDSNFVLADVSPMTAQEFFEQMIKERIIVRKFGEFRGFKGEYVRVNAGTKEETDKFMEAISSL